MSRLKNATFNATIKKIYEMSCTDYNQKIRERIEKKVIKKETTKVCQSFNYDTTSIIRKILMR